MTRVDLVLQHGLVCTGDGQGTRARAVAVHAGQVVALDADAQSLADEDSGNKLLWNPWNAPKDHKPLGQLMRARKFVYPGSGRERGAVSPAKP